MAEEQDDPKAVLHRYLSSLRETVLWKLEGIGEREARWPMTPTGTNLLGLVKHLAAMELGYFAEVFDRPSGIPQPWFDDGADDNADLFATAEESLDSVTSLYRAAVAHADATIEALPLYAPGFVAWWGAERGRTTLQHVMVHMITETARHAGHLDIVRELTDGAVGVRSDNSNLPEHDAAWWQAYTDRLRALAEEAGGR